MRAPAAAATVGMDGFRPGSCHIGKLCRSPEPGVELHPIVVVPAVVAEPCAKFFREVVNQRLMLLGNSWGQMSQLHCFPFGNRTASHL